MVAGGHQTAAGDPQYNEGHEQDQARSKNTPPSLKPGSWRIESILHGAGVPVQRDRQVKLLDAREAGSDQDFLSPNAYASSHLC